MMCARLGQCHSILFPKTSLLLPILLTVEPKHAKNINKIETASKSVGLSSKHSMHYRRYSGSSGEKGMI